MKELLYVRPSYETRGDREPLRFVDGHRLLRMAAAVAEILQLPFALVSAACDAIALVENGVADEPRFAVAQVTALSELTQQVEVALLASVDQDGRPRGEGGDLIKEEAAKPLTLDGDVPDYDRVFELDSEGRVGTAYPRMSLIDLLDTLPELTQFLRAAVSRHLEVALVE